MIFRYEIWIVNSRDSLFLLCVGEVELMKLWQTILCYDWPKLMETKIMNMMVRWDGGGRGGGIQSEKSLLVAHIFWAASWDKHDSFFLQTAWTKKISCRFVSFCFSVLLFFLLRKRVRSQIKWKEVERSWCLKKASLLNTKNAFLTDIMNMQTLWNGMYLW
jgi:hypothetical protein